ncbi:MAG: hypothetical protein IIC67_00760 [Thaumarchaeota archaeon]|nr:hypothetical protein [Nitrososphaerota archaeon]
MVNLQKLVEKELLSDSDSNKLIPLWRSIFQWHDEGGSDNVKTNLLSHLKEIDSEVLKSIKEISPVKKTRKKTRKKSKKAR